MDGMAKRIKIVGDHYERFAVLCDLAYKRGPKLASLGYGEYRRICDSDGKTLCRIAWNSREIIIVFRGTQHWGDWLTNLKIWKNKIQGDGYRYHVHAGFRRALDERNKGDVSVYQQIEKIIEDARTNRRGVKRRVYLLGHSLGGALATLTALRLELDGTCEVTGVYTFGQPAVGGHSFEMTYRHHPRIPTLNPRTFRICSGIDIVTFLPFPFYRHVGNQVWIYNDEIVTDPVRWYGRILRALVSATSSTFTSHTMKKYIRHGIIFRLN
jgi:predicted lipase